LRRSSVASLSPPIFFAVIALTATGCGTLSRALEAGSTATSTISLAAPTPLPDGDRHDASVPHPQGVSTDDNALAAVGIPLIIAAGEHTAVAVAEPSIASHLAGNAPTGRAGTQRPEAAGDPTNAVGGDPPAGMGQVRETTIGDVPEDYDPWESYNERMFAFNYNVDKYVMKPTANVYRHIMPEPFQLMISNGFDNVRYPARLVNHLLQLRFWGAFIETSRFFINTVMGFGGLFNPATDYFGIPKSRADFGQTMARWGVGPGPFFVPPFLPPATVRDFIGRLADSAINPIAWFLIDFWPEGISIGVGEMVNERALNYELFQGVEETTLDLYTAVRDGYLRRRERQLREDVE
jgi:phospholipid-binding lipoprotein MlaA